MCARIQYCGEAISQETCEEPRLHCKEKPGFHIVGDTGAGFFLCLSHYLERRNLEEQSLEDSSSCVCISCLAESMLACLENDTEGGGF